MELVKPAFGLVFWMSVSFLIILFLLKKFAWPIILKALDEREQTIADALDAARKAKDEMAVLTADNERLLQEARNQRDLILKEARDAKDSIIGEARTKATEEADRLRKIAREEIQNEKNAAIAEMKNQVATLSLQIAEKILRQELGNEDRQKNLIAGMLEDVNVN
ncbi:MAG TPA: F0F1 ATP synthase subunit B [Bacteroidia bacterium]|nr:F0F1 ATP synthase subunit B [Bacteroidia bacterium]